MAWSKLCVVFCLATLLAGTTCWSASVKDFGAVGDGVADDTVAIEKAIVSGKGDIDFPAGTYRVTRTIKIELDKVGYVALTATGAATVAMAGEGPAFHFVGTHGGSADPGQFQPNVWQKQRMPVVRGLEFVGEHDNADAIEATGVMQLSLDGVLIRECRHGLHLTTRNRNILVSNCHIYHNRGCGIFYDHVNLHQSNIVGCHISYCAQGGIVFRGAEVRNVHVGTCDIESNMAPTTEPTANVLIDCRGGSTAEVAITGCTIQHNSKSPGSANIRVIGNGVTSTRNETPTQEGHIAITGNVFSDVMVNVHLQSVRGVSIVGNTFWEGFEHDLLIEDSQAVVIGPNDLDRNPRYVVNGHWSEDRGGIVLKNCEDCKLNGLLVKGVWKKSEAVLLDHCRRTTLHDLSILDCDGVGLAVVDCERCRVSDCVVDDSRSGDEHRSTAAIKISGGAKNLFRDNDLTGLVIEERGGSLNPSGK